MSQRWLQSVGFVVTLGGCGVTAQRPAEPRPERGVITRLEMEQRGIEDAYQAVRLLSGRFVRPGELSGAPGAVAPVVYLDGIRAVGLEALRHVSRSQVSEIRLARATTDVRYDSWAIAVLVTTVRPD